MADKLSKKRITNEIRNYTKDNFSFPNLILRPDTDNIYRWYFLVHGLVDTPYEGGVYFGKITLPENYPFAPPDFVFLTPNGRFETDKKICTTFSSYHKESFSTAWNILTMMEGLISFMTEEATPDTGIGSIMTSVEERQLLADMSISWNLSNELYSDVFGHEFEL
jgi:ubiquitin-conjugating enzyme E2 J2